MSTDPKLRDEIAGLTEAVHELRDREVAGTIRDLRAEVEKLRAERSAQHCHGGCHCGHYGWHGYTWYPTTYGGVTNVGGAAPMPTTVTINSTDAGNYMLGYAGTNVAAGAAPAATTMYVNTLS